MWGWGGGSQNLCHYSCFASKVVSFGAKENSKITAVLSHETTKLTSLFQIAPKQVLVLVLFVSI
jgi:hypothetical protein